MKNVARLIRSCSWPKVITEKGPLFMGWLYTILRCCSEVYCSDVAVQIATRQKEIVWERVGQRVMALQPAEARGYVRARDCAHF